MKLAEPKTKVATFRREIAAEYAYLAGGDVPFIQIDCRPAGYLNAPLMADLDQIDLQRRVSTAEIGDKKGIESEMVRDKAATEFAEARVSAIIQHCVVAWQTNILDDGQAMQCTPENLVALAGVRHPAIAAVMLDFFGYVAKVGDFIVDADEETAKN